MRAVAAFPDLHPGRFGPVGAAFLADRIWPQLVGPDIGCGMALFRLDLPRHRLRIDKAARRLETLDAGADPGRAAEALAAAGLVGRIGPEGLGTIGDGNHFCEMQAVEEGGDPALGLQPGALCLLVHSGSRGREAQVFEGLDDDWKQGFAPDSAAAGAYLALHDAAIAWARVNRTLIADGAAEALGCGAALLCDVLHNHVATQAGLWLHRKGAASFRSRVPARRRASCSGSPTRRPRRLARSSTGRGGAMTAPRCTAASARARRTSPR